jgi:NADH dehydrogenase
VLIVGGGFGGLETARALARDEVEVTLVDKTNHHLFQPLLYQVATAALSPADIAEPLRHILRRQKNARVLLTEATGVDKAARVLHTTDGPLEYDFLVLAAGARHSYFGNDAWEARAPGLKTLADALEIRRRILLAFEEAEKLPDPSEQKAALTFVVAGAGPTGVELAGAIAEIARVTLARDFRNFDPASARVILADMAPRVLAAFPPELSEKARRQLEALGVEVRLGTGVTRLDSDVVGFTDGSTLRARTVLWAAGNAASPLARALGVPVDRQGRVIIQTDLSIPGHPEIFALGDMVHFPTSDGPLPGLCPVAMQQGRHAAANIRRALRGEPPSPFSYLDKGTMATIGRHAAVADAKGLHLSGFPAWLAWLFVHLLFLVSFRNKFMVLLNWLWAYLTFGRGARLITRSADSQPNDCD